MKFLKIWLIVVAVIAAATVWLSPVIVGASIFVEHPVIASVMLFLWFTVTVTGCIASESGDIF